MILGFAVAMISMVLFGVYMVPRKYCRLQHLEFVLSMGFGVVLTALPAWGWTHLHAPVNANPASLAYAFLCGPIWTLGMIAFTWAVAESGLTLATPVKNTTAVLGALVGLVFFGETQTTTAWMALAGSAFIVLCAVHIGKAGEVSDKHFQLTQKGIIYSLLAAFFFAAYTYPLKLAMREGMDPYSIVLFMALGIVAFAGLGLRFTGGSFKHWAKQPFRDHLFGMLAGSLWAMATMTMNAAIARIGLAVTWPITNLNTVVAVLIGAMVFHEVHLERQKGKLALGMLYATIGVLLLGLSKL